MTDLIEVKIVELVGPALDWAVAQIEGVNTMMLSPRKGEPQKPFALFGSLALSVGGDDQSSYAPSSCWHCGGPLIDKYHVQTSFNGSGFSRSPTGEHWCAYACNDNGAESHPSGSGPSALIAVCRAIVAARHGETVQVPKELIS